MTQTAASCVRRFREDQVFDHEHTGNRALRSDFFKQAIVEHHRRALLHKIYADKQASFAFTAEN